MARSAGSTVGCTSRSGAWRTSGACWARALERALGASSLTAKDFAALISLGALWGASFLFIRVAVPALGPFVLVGLRVGLATLVLVLVAAATRRTLKLRGLWGPLLFVGFADTAGAFSLSPARGVGRARARAPSPPRRGGR